MLKQVFRWFYFLMNKNLSFIPLHKLELWEGIFVITSVFMAVYGRFKVVKLLERILLLLIVSLFIFILKGFKGVPFSVKMSWFNF